MVKSRVFNEKSKLIISYAILVLLSWARYIHSGTLSVDNVVMVDMIGQIFTVLFVLAIVFHFIFYIKNYEKFDTSWLSTVLIINIISFFMLPCISNDIFSLLAYGDAYNSTTNIYYQSIPPTTFLKPFLSNLYLETPCVYGIITVLLAKLSVYSQSIWTSLFTFKILCFFLGLAVIWWVNKLNYISDKNKLFFLLNPLWTIHAIGQVHSEVISVGLLIFCFYCIHRVKYIAYIFFWLACFSKLSMILCLPMLYLYLNQNKPFQFKSILAFIFQNAILLVSFLALFYWYYGELYFIIKPLETIAEMWATGSFATYFDSILSLLKLQNYLSLVVLLLKIAFVVYTVSLMYIYRNQWIEKAPILLFGILSATLLIYSHRFMTWYLILMLPLFFWIETRQYQKAFMLMGLFYTLQDSAHFNHTQPLTTIILAIAIVLTIIYQLKVLQLPFKANS